MKFIYYLFIIALLPLGCLAQLSISGRVLNQADTKPVADASVFLSNTVTGNKTGKDGTFILENVKPGKYKLAISIIGFETYTETITVSNSYIHLPDITILPKTTGLKEVTIRVNRDRDKYFNMYYERFKKEFIGSSARANDCKIINPQVLDFDYDGEINTLTVSSSGFLEIDNDDLGYKIEYLLTKFRLNDYTNEVHYEGPVLFTEKKGSPGQVRQWQQNRKTAYEGSIVHFLRSLTNDELEEEGFRAFQLATYANPDRLPDDKITTKITKFSDPDYRKKIDDQTNNGCMVCLVDSLPIYKRMAKLLKTLQTLFPYPLNKTDLMPETNQPGLFALGCDSAKIVIDYDKNHHFTAVKNLQDFNNLNYVLNKYSNNELTLMQLTGTYVFFDVNGWIEDPNSIKLSGAWSADRVAGLLPVNYEPEQDKAAILYAGSVVKNIESKLGAFTVNHPAEKVHLHLDRPWYGLGDTIWFKAYTVAGEFHAPSTISNVLYTELIGDNDSVVNRHVIQLNNGTGKGDFAIPFAYKSGTYRIRAYTNWMRNDSDYFYDQPIIVGGLVSQPPGGKQAALNQPLIHPAQIAPVKPDVQFFPEGGDLVNGLRSKVAFKAVNADGSAANIAGTITDQDGNEVAFLTTQHAGMGEFPLTPQPGRRYVAKILCADGTGYLVDLPKAKETGFTLTVNNTADSLYIKVAANDALFRSRQDTSFYVVAQSGGKYYFTAGGKLTNRVFSTQIAGDRFPSGVLQFTLFSQSGEPLNERVVFIQNKDQLKLDLSADSQSYAPNQKVTMTLYAANKQDRAVAGSFSVSVADDTKVPVDEPAEATIFTDLLLTPELKGHIENPNYYFMGENDKTRSDLDLLMLTQGYRRFEWKKILANALPAPAFRPETSLSLSGVITTPGNKPLPNAKVRLTSIKDYFAADTLTDANGNFVFSNLNFPDTTKVIINAKKAKGGDNVKIIVKEPSYPVINKISYNFNPNDTSVSISLKNALAKTYITSQQNSLKNVIQLKQVDIKERKRNPVFEPVYSDNMNFSSNLNGPGNANQVLLGDKLIGCIKLSDCLRGKLQGVSFSITGVPFSNRDSNRHFTGAKPMAVFIDGMQRAGQDLDNINAEDVYSIEVLTSVSYLAIYGSNAPYGALIITMKRGSDYKATDEIVDGLITYKFRGFYKAREFYSPKYAAGQSINTADDRKTIYWNPDIITDASGKASFTFFNAGSRGVYRVVAEGIDGYGNIGRQVYRYKVE